MDSLEISPDAMHDGLRQATSLGIISETDAKGIQAATGYTGARTWLPHFCRDSGMVHGMADRLHTSKKARIEMLGNGQVPLQAALAWLLLAEGEDADADLP
jgi:hypothetical protein